MIQVEEQKEKNEEKQTKLWGFEGYYHTEQYTLWESRRRREIIWRDNDWKLPKFGEICELQKKLNKLPSRINQKRFTPTLLMIKLSKPKAKWILKVAREKQLVISQGIFSNINWVSQQKTLEARRQWDDIYLKY